MLHRTCNHTPITDTESEIIIQMTRYTAWIALGGFIISVIFICVLAYYAGQFWLWVLDYVFVAPVAVYMAPVYFAA